MYPSVILSTEDTTERIRSFVLIVGDHCTENLDQSRSTVQRLTPATV